MTFSIRTFLIVIAILSVWLGALVSKSPLLVELAASGTVLLILLSLALAIWEPRPLQRAFWTGFFALAFGNLVYNGFFSSYQQTSNQVAQVIMGNQPTYGPAPYMYPAPAAALNPAPVSQVSYSVVEDVYVTPSPPPATRAPVSDEFPEADPNGINEIPPNPNAVPQPVPVMSTGPAYPSTTYIQMPAYGNPSGYFEQREAIRASVPSLLSLLMGVIGGCVTMWIASRPKPAAA